MSEAIKQALQQVLNAGRGTSGRIILEYQDEEIVRAALASLDAQPEAECSMSYAQLLKSRERWKAAAEDREALLVKVQAELQKYIAEQSAAPLPASETGVKPATPYINRITRHLTKEEDEIFLRALRTAAQSEQPMSSKPVAVFEGYVDGVPVITWLGDSVPVGTEFYVQGERGAA